MGKPLSVLLLVLIALILTFSAAARGPGGGSGGLGHGSPAGPSARSEAYENSNGRFAQDRDRGLERAEDRARAERFDHEREPDDRRRRSDRPARGDAKDGRER